MKDEVGRTCSTEMMRYAYKTIFRKSEEKRPMGIWSYRCEGKTGFKGMGCGVMEWIQLVQDRDLWQDGMNVVISCQVNKR